MYVAAGLAPLSEAQVKKLLKGQPVRVKAGTQHKVHLSSEQHKKLQKAHSKGAGITLQLDPYQCDGHSHMIGSGFLSKAKALASKAVSGAKKAFAAAPVGLKSAIKSKAMEGLKAGLERVAPEVERRFGKIGSEALSHVGDAASQQVMQFGEPENEIIGMGARPRRKAPIRGGALKLRDLREGAKKVGRAVSRVGQQVARAAAPILGSMAGAELGGPMGAVIGSRLASAAVGSGVKRRGRPRKGGALYTAGFRGGSLD